MLAASLSVLRVAASMILAFLGDLQSCLKYRCIAAGFRLRAKVCNSPYRWLPFRDRVVAAQQGTLGRVPAAMKAGGHESREPDAGVPKTRACVNL